MSVKQRIVKAVAVPVAALAMVASVKAQLAPPVNQTPSGTQTTINNNNAPSASATAIANGGGSGPISITQKAGNYNGGLSVGLGGGDCSMIFGVGAMGFNAVAGGPLSSCGAMYTAAATVNNNKDPYIIAGALTTLKLANRFWGEGMEIVVNNAFACDYAVDLSPIFATQTLTLDQCAKLGEKIRAKLAASMPPPATAAPLTATVKPQKQPCTGCKPVQNNNQQVVQNIHNYGFTVIRDGKVETQPPAGAGTPTTPSPK